VASTFDAGQIEASLTLNRDDFDEELQGAQDDAHEAFDAPIVAKLDLNKDEFDKEVDESQDQLEELDATVAEPSVDLDDAEAEADLDEFTAQFADLDDMVAGPLIDLDDLQAEADLDEFVAQFADLDGDVAQPLLDLDDDEAVAALAQFQADFEDLDGDVAMPELDLEDEEALLGIQEVRTDLDELEDTPHVVNLEVDSAEADAALGGTQLELEGLQAESDVASLHFQNMYAGIEDPAAAAAIAILEQRVVNLNSDLQDAQGAVNATRAAFQELENDMAVVAGDMGGGGAGGSGGGFGGLDLDFLTAGPGPGWLTWIAALPAAIGLVQGLYAGVGAMATAFAAAGAEALVFGVVAYGAISKVMTAISAGTQLTGGLGELEDAIKGIESTWDALYAEATPGVLNDLIGWAQNIKLILPELGPLFQSAGASMDDFFTPIFAAMENPNFTGFISWLAEIAGPAISSFGVGWANIGIAIGNWMQDFGPMLSTFESGVEGISKDWSTLAQSLGVSPEWTAFLTQSKEDLPEVGKLFGDLGNAIGQIFISLGPEGPAALQSLDTILGNIGKIVTPLLAPLGQLGGSLLALIGDVSGQEVVQQLADGLGSLVGSVASLIDHNEGLFTAGVDLLLLYKAAALLAGTNIDIFFTSLATGEASFSVAGLTGLLGDPATWAVAAALGAGILAAMLGSDLQKQLAHVLNPSDIKTITSGLGQGNSIDIPVHVTPEPGVETDQPGWQNYFALLGDDIQGWLNEYVKPPANFSTQLGPTLATWAAEGFETFTSWVSKNSGPDIISAFVGLPGWLAGIFLPGNFLAYGEHLVSGLLTGSKDEWPEVESWIKGWPGDIAGFIGNPATWLVTQGVDIVSGLFTGNKSEWVDVGKWFTGLPADVVGWLGDAGSWLVQAGKDIITGLIQGIESEVGSLMSTVTGLANDVTGLFGIHIGANSPSTVFAEFGKNIDQGVEVGVSDNAALAVNAVSAMGRQVVAAGNQALSAGSVGASPTVNVAAPDNSEIVNELRNLRTAVQNMTAQQLMALRTA
jgi:hypothetical protein